MEVTATISGCPALGDFLPEGSALLQNIPSIACVHVLNPKRGEAVLDMCASPGNKTTLIAALMENIVSNLILFLNLTSKVLFDRILTSKIVNFLLIAA